MILKTAIKKIVYILNAIIRRGYWYNNVLFSDCAKFWKQNTFNLDIVNTGSTSGKFAFNYDCLPVKAANWAMGPQTFMADLEILRNYSSFLKPDGATVLIPLCPFSCLGGSCLYMPDKYYSILNMASIPYGNYKKAIEVKDKQRSPLMHYPLMAIPRDIKYLFVKDNKEYMDENKMRDNADNMMKGWMFEFSIIDFKDELILKNKDAYEDSVKALSDIIDFCTERSFRPVIVLPPVTKFLAEKFTPDMLNLFVYNFVEKANKQSVTFLDYWNDPEFSDPKLYRSAFFLNSNGARKFTERVLRDLKVI